MPFIIFNGHSFMFYPGVNFDYKSPEANPQIKQLSSPDPVIKHKMILDDPLVNGFCNSFRKGSDMELFVNFFYMRTDRFITDV